MTGNNGHKGSPPFRGPMQCNLSISPTEIATWETKWKQAGRSRQKGHARWVWLSSESLNHRLVWLFINIICCVSYQSVPDGKVSNGVCVVSIKALDVPREVEERRSTLVFVWTLERTFVLTFEAATGTSADSRVPQHEMLVCLVDRVLLQRTSLR